ncbi:MAG: lipoprotein signal peptidase [Campylobacteraceae bacterium]|jgi:signal peptidase II|nr:lipoprotein signal peptidase [Campylobacteraceae bacterium]MBT3882855.1 lipoprotein signal peptidase [Campylobacteraceae bacterium]MBT4030281.1 lipoprotein signal peptidase [Campylobacteraceae bacterium]MBT4179623.1 lipoprotein signal peptidase [Campylobacteraceae bacterium]MBT4572986.1 lipoprotein signal peptidase [Campylobacteraceae bacterium]
MLKKLFLVLIIFIIAVSIDQYIKFIFVNGYVWHSECISLVLAYNKGVAFSMFAFLDSYLKYIQIMLILVGMIYLYKNKDIFTEYYIPIALLFSGGISNVFDRFIHVGVVDYVYWHCKFDFAIFNLADVLIDLAVVIIIYKVYKSDKKGSLV